ncbi:MAG: zinc-binding dehydrogenase [Bacilli bacterium]|nr:zinc-binding dehydrogenase [Bacilli bacterium]
MKCVSISGEKKFVLKDINKPVSNDGSVVIEVKSCGICGSDIHYWVSGNPVGLVMGHEFAGVVVNPGSRDDLKVGDKVTGLPISPCLKCDACRSGNYQYCPSTWSEAVGLSLTNTGAYADFTSCRADMVRKIPNSVSYDAACMTEPTAVSLHAVNIANVNIGDRVLIVGGGIIGLMAAEFAKMNGAGYVVMLETNSKRGKKAVNYGRVDEYYDATDENTVSKLIEKTKGGFDKVIECCGSAPAVTEAFMCVKPGGTIVLAGVSLDPVAVPTVVPIMKEAKILTAIAYSEKEFDMALKLISSKKINVVKYIDDFIKLDQAQEAFERLTSGKDAAVKIVFKP